MAFTLIAHAAASSSDGQQVQCGPIDCTGANLIVIETSIFEPFTIPPTDSSSNTWLPLTQRGGSLASTQFWYCLNPTVSAAQTFKVPPGNIAFPAISVQAWSSDSLPITLVGENGHAAQALTSAQPGNITSTLAHALIITGASAQNGQPTAVNLGFTLTDRVNFSSQGLGIGMGYIIPSAATTLNPTWSGTGLQATAIVCFQDVPPGPLVTLALSSGSATPGTPITLTVSIANIGGAAPSAVQWTINFPLGSISGITAATVGAAATSASKTLTQLGNNFEIEGPNINVIGDGVIANITFQLTLNNAPVPNPIPIQILSVQASDINGNLIPSVGVLGDVTALTLSTACPLNTATIGASYFAALAGAGGTAPYTWLVSSGLLPAGIILDSSTGVLNGIATALGVFSFVIEIMDANGVIFLTGGCHITVSSVTPTNPGLCDNPATDVTLDCYLELTKVLVAFKPNKRLPVRGRS